VRGKPRLVGAANGDLVSMSHNTVLILFSSVVALVCIRQRRMRCVCHSLKRNGKWRMKGECGVFADFNAKANRTRRHKESVVCNIDVRFRAHPPVSS